MIIMKKFISFLKSVKLTVFLLILLAIFCGIGTLLPQNQSPSFYTNQFGRWGAHLIDVFSLYDLYHARWFQLLLLLFGINLVVCSLDRFPKSWKVYTYHRRIRNSSDLSHLPLVAKFDCHQDCQSLKAKLTDFVKKKGGSVSDDGLFIIDKGRISILAPYILHIGILIVLIGALISFIKGFSGMMFIKEGERSNTVFLEGHHHQFYNLPFSVECEKFKVEFYPNGQPKEYQSKLKIIDGHQTIVATVRVNHPLVYKGIHFYQASYNEGLRPPGVPLTLQMIDRKAGKAFKIIIKQIGQPVNLPQGAGILTLEKATVTQFGPTFFLNLKRGKAMQKVILLSKFPTFDSFHRHGRYVFVITDFPRVYTTGIEVRRDPGVWVVWIGCLILIGGLMIAFFIIPRQFWIMLEPSSSNKCVVWIGGLAPKRKQVVENMFNKLQKEVREVLGC